jgi:non-lysosomal glucosylceramidase
VARLVHDRYHPRLRNPYNEIECGDHYARAMASYGAYLAACGFGYHGPKGHISFAPRLTPENFKAAFTAAEGWGTFAQTRQDDKLTTTLALKYGSIRLKTFGLELPASAMAAQVTTAIDGTAAPASLKQTGSEITVAFTPEIRVDAGQTLSLIVTYTG